MFQPSELFDLSKTEHAKIYENTEFAWEALPKIKDYINTFFQNQKPTDPRAYPTTHIGDKVFIGEGTTIEPGAVIIGPAIIGKNCKIRNSAYIRENVIIGNDCTIGNSCEFKNSLLHDKAEVPHFAYVGDSLLGYKAHFGAGVKVSNLKIARDNVVLKVDGKNFETGLRKFGGIVGDEAEVGCNSVLNPGTIIGKRTLAVTNLALCGYYPPDSFIKLRQTQEITKRY